MRAFYILLLFAFLAIKVSAQVSYKIPVVVHVMSYGSLSADPTDEDIKQTINYLNSVYSGNSVMANLGVGNTEIQFELAKRDPSGNCTNGITRDTNVTSAYIQYGVMFSQEMPSILNGITEDTIKSNQWDNTKYLNIWLVSHINSYSGLDKVTGFAYSPSNTSIFQSSYDGVVVLLSYFRPAALNQSDLRQMNHVAHEVGHFLNLYHVFEDGLTICGSAISPSCNFSGDLCCDTDPVINPIVPIINPTWVPRTGLSNLCVLGLYSDNTERNIMSYSTESVLFTANQKTRMHNCLNNYPFRHSLWDNTTLALISPSQDLMIENSNPNSLQALKDTNTMFLDFKYKVINNSSLPSPANYISFHLSTDTILTPGLNGDIWLTDTLFQNSLLGSTSNNLSKSSLLTKQIPIPSTTVVGEYYIFIAVDGTNIISECEEYNNFAREKLYITQTNSVALARYWFDNDFTNHQNLIGPVYSQGVNININTNQLTVGTHQFNIQFRELGSGWSSISSSLFYKAPIKILGSSKYQYWFDTDYYSAITQGISQNDNFEFSPLIDISSLKNGAHTLHVRFKTTNDTWSSINSNIFYKASQPLIGINAYEYWIDTTYTNVVFNNTTDTNNFVQNEIIQLSNTISAGYHVFNIRYRHDDSTWSSIVSDSFYNAKVPIPAFTYINTNTCTGSVSFTNTSFPAHTYKWYFGDGDSSLIKNPTHTYSATGTYTITLYAKDTISGLDSVATFLINVQKNNPNTSYIGIVPSNFCTGDTTQLVVNNTVGYTYQWYKNNVAIAGATNSNINVYQAGNYKVTITNAGCSSTSTQVSVSALPKPNLTVGITDSTICGTSGATIFLNGANSYLCINTGDTSTMFNVYPSVSTTYTIIGTGINGCTKTKTQNVFVLPLPNTQISTADSVLCLGDTTLLIPTGASTYLWFQPPLGGTGNLTTFPTTNSQYVVRGTDTNGCYAFDTLNVLVNQLPIVSITATQDTICVGDTTILTASGGTNIIWQSIGSNNPITVNPISNLTYIATITDTNNCVSTASKSIIVDTLPIVQITSITDSICNGDTITLNAGGAINYSWNPNLSNGSTLSDNPIANAIYSVIGTDANGCSNSISKTITVLTLPIISISSSTNAICIGDSITLNAIGGNTYQWLPNNQVTNNITEYPTVNTNYIVNGTDTFGCMGNDSVQITVNPLPIVQVSNDTTICIGDSIIINANGGSNYTWLPNNNITNNSVANPTVYPTVNTNFMVNVIDSNNCSQKDSVLISVQTLPSIYLGSDTTLCNGQTITLDAGNGFTNYLWFGGTNNSTLFVDSANTYWVEVTNSFGCSNTDTIVINYTICLSVNDFDNGKAIVKVYPNPTTGTFTIDFETTKNRNLKLFNSAGQVIFATKLTQKSNSINIVNTVASGVYSLQIEEDRHVVVFKLIKE